MKTLLACDMGASNGRIVAGLFDGKRIELQETHRFPNNYINEGKHFYWDFTKIIAEIESGLRKTDSMFGRAEKSIGFDTWGVDFGLLDHKGGLLDNPFSYRDTYPENYKAELENLIGDFQLFEQTGNELNAINTIFQLYAMSKEYPEQLKGASSIMMMPTLLSHYFSGVKVNEFTISSTTQLLNWTSKDWNKSLITSVFNRNLPLEKIQMPHVKLGEVKKEIKTRLNIGSMEVILVPGHDTACALSAFPMNDADTAFISLGTWGIIGKITDSPLITKEVFKQGFTNEGTSEGRARLQKNSMGFWILQCLRKEWGNVTYDMENKMLEHSAHPSTWIDPDDSLFFNPGSMIEAISQFCKKTNQLSPHSKEEFFRCVVESMALNYRYIIERIEKLTCTKIRTIYMGGGGIQNTYLCQILANASNRTVITGSTESSSLGNLLSQLRAQNEVSSLVEGWELVQKSIEERVYEPMNQSYWQAVINQFDQLKEGSGGGVR